MKKPLILLAACLSFTLVSYAQPGEAINFDGVDDYCDPNILVSNVSNNFTYEMWARPTATHDIDVETNSTVNISGLNGQRYAIWPTWRGVNAGVGISVGTNGVSVYEHGSNYLASILTWTGTLNGWTHIAVVVNNKVSNLYINGQFVKAGLNTNMPNLYPSLGECGQYGPNTGGIGGGTYGYYKGDMDELRYWSVARTQAEITANMYSELKCKTGLLAYYKFNHGIANANNGTVTAATDYSGNNYTAQLANFALTSFTGNWFAPGAVPTLTATGITVSPSNTTICQGKSLQLSVSDGTLFNVMPGNLNVNTITIQPNQPTTYTITAILGPGCSFTASANVQVSKCTDIDESLVGHVWQIFPNPAAAVFTVLAAANAEARLYNVSGRLVKIFKIDSDTFEVDAAELSAGLYYLYLNKGTETQQIKLIKE